MAYQGNSKELEHPKSKRGGERPGAGPQAEPDEDPAQRGVTRDDPGGL